MTQSGDSLPPHRGDLVKWDPTAVGAPAKLKHHLTYERRQQPTPPLHSDQRHAIVLRRVSTGRSTGAGSSELHLKYLIYTFSANHRLATCIASGTLEGSVPTPAQLSSLPPPYGNQSSSASACPELRVTNHKCPPCHQRSWTPLPTTFCRQSSSATGSPWARSWCGQPSRPHDPPRRHTQPCRYSGRKQSPTQGSNKNERDHTSVFCCRAI